MTVENLPGVPGAPMFPLYLIRSFMSLQWERNILGKKFFGELLYGSGLERFTRHCAIMSI